MKFFIYCTILNLLLSYSNAQIHRATNTHNYQIKYNSNFTLQYYLKRLNSFETLDNCFYPAYLTDIANFLNNEKLIIWVTSVIGTFFVGICGILPVIILPNLADDHQKLIKSNYFKCLVGFAAGTLLGDVFLHLLPETYTQKVLNDNDKLISNGIWLLFGIISFLSLEKFFSDDLDDSQGSADSPSKLKSFLSIKILGLLNLFANVIDNFTHGIAVAGGFQASIKFGFMTLIATLLHEIPHEIGDFVILLKSGLTYKKAALAQLTTAFSGIMGAIFALGLTSAERAGDLTSWILPFTSGGFLYISLVNIVPEILNEKDFKSSLSQVCSLILGIVSIYLLSFIF
ncbi:unnamed protein product [Brachionus calyciflorus]|uniref:Uncharacterized protein n=1 Tax=Brachionus calyciflorus TaxID=104777 RepID=A0A813ML96_9BILA|nr:unnamed protein product [Brachionus calyciflorus]